MRIKNIHLRKIVFVFSFSSLFIGIIYAAGLFPSSLPVNPDGQTPNGSFSARLTNISSITCPSKSFIKGFDANYKPVCVPYNTPTFATLSVLSSPSGFPGSSPSGEMTTGKFGTYFKNLYNVCSGNWVLRGFTSQWQKICADAQNRTNLLSSPSSVLYGLPSISYPAKPSSEPTNWGKFQSFFTAMFTSCSSNTQAIQSISSAGVPSCANIPVDGTCGWSNGGSFYTVPSSGLCNIWNQTGVSWSGPWSWSCVGLDDGAVASCSANKKIDCVGSWNNTSTCSKSCWGWVLQQAYKITTNSAYGGINCPVSDGTTQAGTTSCNTQSCCTVGVVWQTSCVPHPNGSCWWTALWESNTWSQDWWKQTEDSTCIQSNHVWCTKYQFKENTCSPSSLVWVAVCNLYAQPGIGCGGTPWYPSTWRMVWGRQTSNSFCTRNTIYWCTVYGYR